MCQNTGFVQFEPGLNKNAISLCMQDQEYIANIKEVQVYLDKVMFSTTLSALIHLPFFFGSLISNEVGHMT